MSLVCKYLALHVPDLRAAEDFYCRTLGLDVLFREAERDGEWWTLRAGTGWEAADAAGVEVGMVALRRGDLVLALFRGTPAPGTVYEISVGVPRAEMEQLLGRRPRAAHVHESRAGFVRFDDPFGFRWVLQDSDADFRSSGEIAGRWLGI